MPVELNIRVDAKEAVEMKPNAPPISVPDGVIERLPSYLECLIQVRQEGLRTISSQQIGRYVGVNPAEIRRDFTYFGTFGKKGVGYNIDYLITQIQGVLGFGEEHKIALVGAGNLGAAICDYDGLPRHGFPIVAVFDSDPQKIGKKLDRFIIRDVRALPKTIKRLGITVGVIAVPASAAQKVADMMVEGGVKVILSYAPTMIQLPDHVHLHITDPVKELLHTLYYLSRTGRTQTSSISEKERVLTT